MPMNMIEATKELRKVEKYLEEIAVVSAVCAKQDPVPESRCGTYIRCNYNQDAGRCKNAAQDIRNALSRIEKMTG